ncbi:MAG: histidinol-phosphate transaminase [Verrucomicrobia bacterium]|nr:histidinol-phosphate transaminase [Verrucomicrobiota bacterium]
MNIPAKPWVNDLAVYEPGRPLDEVARDLGFESADDIVKLASNENALGPSPEAVKALKNAAEQLHLYPDGGTFYLRKALAEHAGVEMDQIMFGNGSNEILELLGHVFLEEGDEIIMSEHAFVVYRLVADLFRAKVLAVPMKNFTHDLEAMSAAVTVRTKIVFVANPNNPTGTMVDGEQIDAFVAKIPRDVVIVFDEAYVELLPPEEAPDVLKYLSVDRPVYIVRTFSKTYGLAGLRVGYAFAKKECIDLLHHVRQPFNVNAAAQIAAVAALGDEKHVTKTRWMVREGIDYLEESFREMALEWVPTVANFILVKVGPGREIFEALQKERVIVRPMDGYGLPEYIRVTIGTRDENTAFTRALKTVLKSKGLIS